MNGKTFQIVVLALISFLFVLHSTSGPRHEKAKSCKQEAGVIVQSDKEWVCIKAEVIK